MPHFGILLFDQFSLNVGFYWYGKYSIGFERLKFFILDYFSYFNDGYCNALIVMVTCDREIAWKLCIEDCGNRWFWWEWPIHF
jgi:hypothetical protein